MAHGISMGYITYEHFHGLSMPTRGAVVFSVWRCRAMEGSKAVGRTASDEGRAADTSPVETGEYLRETAQLLCSLQGGEVKGKSLYRLTAV